MLSIFSHICLLPSLGVSEPYKVKRGDTLGTIARRYGVTVHQLATVNHITNVNAISVGSVLVIPEKFAAIASTRAGYDLGGRNYLTPQVQGRPIIRNETATPYAPRRHLGGKKSKKASVDFGPYSNQATFNTPAFNTPVFNSPTFNTQSLNVPSGGASLENSMPTEQDFNHIQILRSGLESGWVVTTNPNVDSHKLFVHESAAGGQLTNLRYIIQESWDGSTWTIYMPGGVVAGSTQYGRPVGVTERPNNVTVLSCNCF